MRHLACKFLHFEFLTVCVWEEESLETRLRRVRSRAFWCFLDIFVRFAHVHKFVTKNSVTWSVSRVIMLVVPRARLYRVHEGCSLPYVARTHVFCMLQGCVDGGEAHAL